MQKKYLEKKDVGLISWSRKRYIRQETWHLFRKIFWKNPCPECVERCVGNQVCVMNNRSFFRRCKIFSNFSARMTVIRRPTCCSYIFPRDSPKPLFFSLVNYVFSLSISLLMFFFIYFLFTFVENYGEICELCVLTTPQLVACTHAAQI